MNSIKVSAPGKLHLLGEHSVVYGKPALLTAIDKRIFVTLSFSRKKQIVGAGKYEKDLEKLLDILEKKIQSKLKIRKIDPYNIEINSEFPIGSGMGSSAAISACFTAVLLTFLKIPWDKKVIFEIAYEGEKFFHGNPSGGDLATVIEGGFLWYRKEFEFLKTFEKLPFKPHKNIKKFLLVDSGKPKESTKEMIEKVAHLKKLFPRKVNDLFNEQEDLTRKMTIALCNGDEDLLMQCIAKGERNLESLKVVGRKAKSLINEISKSGGVAKISGAGGVVEGSGVLVAYLSDSKKFDNLLKLQQFIFEEISLGTEGLRKENN